MEEFSENARRFISAYNHIDQSLRNQCDLNKSISYTEAIRKASRTKYSFILAALLGFVLLI